jgi:hypothetical protein
VARGRRLKPLAQVQLCRSWRPEQQTLSVSGIPSCCAYAPRCTPFATPRSCAGHRKGSETSSLLSTLPAAVVKALDGRVLRRLSRLNMHQFDLPLHAPDQKMPTRQLRPVVAADCLRSSPFSHERIQHPRHSPAGKARHWRASLCVCACVSRFAGTPRQIQHVSRFDRYRLKHEQVSLPLRSTGGSDHPAAFTTAPGRPGPRLAVRRGFCFRGQLPSRKGRAVPLHPKVRSWREADRSSETHALQAPLRNS